MKQKQFYLDCLGCYIYFIQCFENENILFLKKD